MDSSWVLLLCNIVVSGAGISLFVACIRFVVLKRPCKTERSAIILSFVSVLAWWIVAAFLIFWLLPESGLLFSNGIIDFIFAFFASKMLSPSASLKRRRQRNANIFRSNSTAEPNFIDLVEGFHEIPLPADDLHKLKNRVRILTVVVIVLLIACIILCIVLSECNKEISELTSRCDLSFRYGYTSGYGEGSVAAEKAVASIFVEYERLSAGETLSYEDRLKLGTLKEQVHHYSRKYYGLEDW